MTVIGVYRALSRAIKGGNEKIAFIFSVLILSVITIVASFLLFYLKDSTPFEFMGGGLVVLSACIFLFSQKYPGFFNDLWIIAKQEQYKKSVIENLNLDAIESDILELLEVEKLYLKENISMRYLAEQLNIRPDQLSRFINEKMGKNFYQLINEKRIELAQKIMKKSPERSIISVAYEVGFNSKSSFNAAFKKFTGISPKNYRESHRK